MRRSKFFVPLSRCQDFAGPGNLVSGGRFHILQGVWNPHLLPFEGAQSVVRQNLYLLDVVQRVEHLAQLRELLLIGGNAWHQYVANPYGFSDVRQIAGAVEDVLVAMTREPTVFLVVDMLDVEQNQVGALHQALEL